MDPTPEAVRVAIVLDIADPYPELLLLWAGARSAELVTNLRQKGVHADIVRIDIDGYPHLSW